MTANAIALLFNALTLALALDMLILILWHDPRNTANRYFSLFLFMMVVWASGSLVARGAAYAGGELPIIRMGLGLLYTGFAGASISIYIFSAVVVGHRGRFFSAVAVLVMVIVFVYQGLLLFVVETSGSFSVRDGVLEYPFDPLGIALYLVFPLATVYLVWANRRKLRSRYLTLGILMFCAGQVGSLISPRLRTWGVAEDVGAIAALLMSYGVVQRQILVPLLGRTRQLEAVRGVGLAITSRLVLQDTLTTIAAQATEMLDAGGSAIFLKEEDSLRVAVVHDLPAQNVGYTLGFGRGMVGKVAETRQAVRIEQYARDWSGEDDLPDARARFGSVVAVPLIFADEVVGVLLVSHGKHGGIFDREDVRMLELLGPQAAAAIVNSRLFEAERELSNALAAAKSQLEAVLAGTRSPVIAFDRQFRCIFANPAVEQVLTLDRAPVGQRLFDFVPPRLLPGSPLRAARDLRLRRSHVYEVALGDRAFLCQIAELGSRAPEGWVAVLNDVTQLKEVDRLKSQMIQMTSHDLKNPLQAAMSYLELLSEDGEGIFTESMRSDLAIVWSQLDRMFRLINGILDLERISSGTGAFQPCGLEDILARVVVDVAARARSKGLTLELDIKVALPAVLADAQQIAQAFGNIVENAVKFTDPGGWIWVRARAEKRQVLVEVEDTGIGIAAQDVPRVFDRFYRVRQPGSDSAEGSGLGLSIVKAIVDRHGGEVQLESEYGKGTTVRVWLPTYERRGE